MKIATLLLGISMSVLVIGGAAPGVPAKSAVPRVWDDAALAEWATPLAGLNARPTHMSSAEYYATPINNLRTYPVYAPGREPAGYWEHLQQIGPAPLLEVKTVATDRDWIAAGKRVFDEADSIYLRTYDPAFINMVRSPASIGQLAPDVLSDGTLPGMRWVPTDKGVALGFPVCSACHTQLHRDGRVIPGAAPGGLPMFRATGIVVQVHYANEVVHAAAPFVMGSQPLGEALYQAWGVPWLTTDTHRQLKEMTRERFEPMLAWFARSGGVPRWDGSIYYPAKTPDLIGIKDRRYIDHTATHLHRDIGDLMRYAAVVTFAEPTTFGPHQVVGGTTTRAPARLSDEALYALARYIYSLQPPVNPNRVDRNARAGQRLFERERCDDCHTPPLYTNNRLTVAEGFTPPADAPITLDISERSVGTDPGLALATRKGTGYYKVPSLKGLWYRPRLLHDGSVSSLEEMFDPKRLSDDHVPGGWMPFGRKTYAIRGHRFGLRLTPGERAQLIAFLRTL